MIRVKVCGMRDPVNISEIAAFRPDYMGFIFYQGSRRYVGPENAPFIRNSCKGIIKTGVFVSVDLSSVLECRDLFGLDAVQLHGGESPEFCAEVRRSGLTVIKAFQIREGFGGQLTEPYKGACDYYLFDTASPSFGGSGAKFNWKLLERYNDEKPFFLSGGIGPDDAEEVIRLANKSLYGVDINSRFETSPGIKDPEKVKNFIKRVKNDGNEI